MPSIASIHFDITGWQIKQRSEHKIVWFNQIPDILILEFSPRPVNLPADMENMTGMQAFVEQMVSQNAGVVVSVESLLCDEIETVKSIFKYRQTASSKRSPLGTVYAALYIFPFDELHYLLKVQCSEYGAIGLREAALADQQTQAEITNHQIVHSMNEMPGPQKVVASLSDDEKYDSFFPLHPLSRLRSYLKHIEETFIAEEYLRVASPFRK